MKTITTPEIEQTIEELFEYIDGNENSVCTNGLYFPTVEKIAKERVFLSKLNSLAEASNTIIGRSFMVPTVGGKDFSVYIFDRKLKSGKINIAWVEYNCFSSDEIDIEKNYTVNTIKVTLKEAYALLEKYPYEKYIPIPPKNLRESIEALYLV